MYKGRSPLSIYILTVSARSATNLVGKLGLLLNSSRNYVYMECILAYHFAVMFEMQILISVSCVNTPSPLHIPLVDNLQASNSLPIPLVDNLQASNSPPKQLPNTDYYLEQNEDHTLQTYEICSSLYT